MCSDQPHWFGNHAKIVFVLSFHGARYFIILQKHNSYIISLSFTWNDIHWNVPPKIFLASYHRKLQLYSQRFSLHGRLYVSNSFKPKPLAINSRYKFNRHNCSALCYFGFLLFIIETILFYFSFCLVNNYRNFQWYSQRFSLHGRLYFFKVFYTKTLRDQHNIWM